MIRPSDTEKLTSDSIVDTSPQTPGILEGFLETIGDTGKVLVKALESQIDIFDRSVCFQHSRISRPSNNK